MAPEVSIDDFADSEIDWCDESSCKAIWGDLESDSAAAPPPGPGPTPPGPGPTPPEPTPPGPTPTEKQMSVAFEFSADRDALFTAWNAMANLADMAGKVNVNVQAESAEGFDKGKLLNGVLEPLREADLIE